MAGFSGFQNNPLMSMGMGLLQASGPSRMPTSMGQALGQGFQQMQVAQQFETRRKLMEAQMAGAKTKATEAKRKAEEARKFEEAIATLPPAEQAMARIAGPAYVTGTMKARATSPGSFAGTGMEAQAINAQINSMVQKWKASNPSATPAGEAALRQALKTQFGERRLMTPQHRGFDEAGNPIITQPQPMPGMPPGYGPPAPAAGIPLPASPSSSAPTPLAAPGAPPPRPVGVAGAPAPQEAALGLLNEPAPVAPIKVGDVVSAARVETETGQPMPPGLYLKTRTGWKLQAAGEKPTEGQERVGRFYKQLQSAKADLAKFEKDAKWTPGLIEDMSRAVGPFGISVPEGVANTWMRSDEYKEYLNAARRWSSNYIYLVSGAQARKDEVDAAVNQYFRAPGDTESVIKQKIEARHAAEAAAEQSAAPALRRFAGEEAPLTPAEQAELDALRRAAGGGP